MAIGLTTNKITTLQLLKVSQKAKQMNYKPALDKHDW
jgi:hypothetical protein